MTQPNEQNVDRDEPKDAGATDKDYGNLSVEDDATGTVDPADLANTAGPDDDGGRQNP